MFLTTEYQVQFWKESLCQLKTFTKRNYNPQVRFVCVAEIILIFKIKIIIPYNFEQLLPDALG